MRIIKNKQAILFFIVFLYCTSTKAEINGTWGLVFQPRQRIVKSLASIEKSIFVGTGNGVFISEDGKTFTDFGNNQLQKDPEGKILINHMVIKNKTIFISTSNGAYKSSIEKPKWEKIFNGSKIESREINSINIGKNKILIASNDGFWLCPLINKLSNKSCTRLNTGLKADIESGNYKINFIYKSQENIYLATSNGIYKLKSRKKRFIWDDISSSIQTSFDGSPNIRHIIMDKNGNLFIATSIGVYTKKEKNGTWKKISEGLNVDNNGQINALFLLDFNNQVLCGTTNGIYELNQEKNKSYWKNISQGIRTSNENQRVYSISPFKDELYIATDEGLFKLNNKVPVPEEPNIYDESTSPETIILKGQVEETFTNIQELEPTVIEVQKEALKFSGLPSNKELNKYKLQAKLRNLLPKISYDINSTNAILNHLEFQNQLTSDTLLNNKFTGQKTLQRQNDGKDYKQFSILWNTNELIYDDEIKEILNQARLSANIKENLLDDITKIYFQRRKVQLEDLIYPNSSINEKISKDLEIAELTSQLDSRTGGWFSTEIERRKISKKYARK